MAQQNTVPEAPQPYKDSFQTKVGTAVEQFGQGNSQLSSRLLIGLVVVVLVVGGALYLKQTRDQDRLKESEALGKAFVALYSGDEAGLRKELEGFLASGPSDPLTRGKANLMMGNLLLRAADAPAAADKFRAAIVDGKGIVLVEAGARHGLAVALMEQSQFDKAATELEAFVKDYSNRSTDAVAIAKGEGGGDQVATVPDASFKLALCYRELKQADKARAVAEALTKSHPASRYAAQARQLIAEL